MSFLQIDEFLAYSLPYITISSPFLSLIHTWNLSMAFEHVCLWSVNINIIIYLKFSITSFVLECTKLWFNGKLNCFLAGLTIKCFRFISGHSLCWTKAISSLMESSLSFYFHNLSIFLQNNNLKKLSRTVREKKWISQ